MKQRYLAYVKDLFSSIHKPWGKLSGTRWLKNYVSSALE